MDETKSGEAPVAESVIAELEQMPKTPIDTAIADIRRALQRDITPGREAERDAAVREYANAVKKDPLTRDYLDRCSLAQSKFWAVMRTAQTPLPDPDPYGAKARRTLVSLGWRGDEIDAVVRAFGFRIESATWDSVRIAGRTHSRESIRLGMRPRWSKMSDAEWLAQFPTPVKVARDHAEFVRMGGDEANPNELVFERR